MDRNHVRWSSIHTSARSIRRVSQLALLSGTYAIIGCSASPQPDAEIGQVKSEVNQAASADTCGYSVTTQYISRWNGKGYLGLLELKNVSGVRATDFNVFVDLHGATPSKCLLADCDPVEGGYAFTPPSWFRLLGLGKGQTYPIPFLSRDAYENITPYVISVNGKLSAFEFAAIGFGLPFGFTGQVQQEKDPTRGTVLAQYPPLKLTQQQAQTALDVVKPQVGTTSPYLTPVPFMGWADCRAYAQAGYALFQKVFGR